MMMFPDNFRVFALGIFGVIAALTVAACNHEERERKIRQEWYDAGMKEGYTRGLSEGRNAGFTEGHQQGHQRGVEETLKKLFPGGHPRASGVLGAMERVLAVLGALKVLLTLVLLIIYLIRKSTTDMELGGKILLGALGFVLGFRLGSDVVSIVQAGLLDARLEAVPGLLLMGIVSLLTYAVFNVTYLYLIKRDQSVWIDAWCICIASALVTIFGQAWLHLYFNVFTVLDIRRYVITDLLLGVLAGGILYLAVFCLKRSGALVFEVQK